MSRHVADIFAASEQEIIDAMRLVWQRVKIVIEPSSAVALAGDPEEQGELRRQARWRHPRRRQRRSRKAAPAGTVNRADALRVRMVLYEAAVEEGAAVRP